MARTSRWGLWEPHYPTVGILCDFLMDIIWTADIEDLQKGEGPMWEKMLKLDARSLSPLSL
ncbi:MAG: hypothetical protein A2051_00985 [Desulfovibrionales bacterium GWA2_65_9]|nr:MAG: hypothetical protein A2051_00985 [Desulfovibrionales bacterium GWA2_65_9]